MARPDRSSILRAALVASLSLLLATGLACRDTSRSAPPGQAEDGLRRYTVRAEVVRLPEAAARNREVALRHEAIDDFADASGKVVGMGSMVMPFEVGPAVALDGVAVGDKVAARFAVGWSPPVLRIEQLRKLPADTALDFRAARPPAGTRP